MWLLFDRETRPPLREGTGKKRVSPFTMTT